MNSSKLIILTIAMFLYCLHADVQAQAIKEGDDVISAGYGFGVIDNEVYTLPYGPGQITSHTGPLYLKYEHAITDKISLGINGAFGQYQYDYGFTYTTFSVLARLNWHFGNLANVDPYWGFGLGYREGSYNNDFSNDDPPIPLALEITIGVRCYLSDKVAIYMETGLAKSVLQVGLSFKLR